MVTDLRSKVYDQDQVIHSHMSSVRSLESDIDGLNREIATLQTKLKESAEIVKNNQGVILYLNQLVNAEALGGYTPLGDTADYDRFNPREVSPRVDGTQAYRQTNAVMETAVKPSRSAEHRDVSPDTVMKVRDTPPARMDANAAGAASGGSYEEDVYLQGLRYLGLGDTPGKLKVPDTFLTYDMSVYVYRYICYMCTFTLLNATFNE